MNASPDTKVWFIIAAVESSDPPFRLLLGKAAQRSTRQGRRLKKDFDAWEKTMVEADFPDV